MLRHRPSQGVLTDRIVVAVINAVSSRLSIGLDLVPQGPPHGSHTPSSHSLFRVQWGNAQAQISAPSPFHAKHVRPPASSLPGPSPSHPETSHHTAIAGTRTSMTNPKAQSLSQQQSMTEPPSPKRIRTDQIHLRRGPELGSQGRRPPVIRHL